MTLHVRHASASGRLDELWDYDASERRLDVLVRLGALETSITVQVCSQARPRLGAHPIKRIDGESWRVLPARFVLHGTTLFPIACPIGDVLVPGEHLILTNAPASVDAELDAL